MPKTIAIAPADQRQPGSLESPPVPLNAYVQDPKVEAKRWGADTLVRVYRDMVLIREFETMLGAVKREGRYGHVTYQHLGPAHLSIGQESAAVGQALALEAVDQVFGSHRSHGEILAKCFAAIEELDETELASTLAGYRGGVCHRAVAKWSTEEGREFAVDFVLYGLLAEVFARDTGLNQGLGGSMHAFFSPFGAMPNNAIVGGSASIATGAALFKRVNRRRGICIANIGDASLGCGPVWESMVFAAMDQYRTLWDPEIGGHPPILFNFMNNFYGMGGQTSGETMGFGVLARVGLGVDANAMHAERVDGYNPLAVADAIERKRAVLEAGDGPVLLDTVTYRLSGHSPSDASSYRDRAEISDWQGVDCIASYRDYLLANGHAKEAELSDIAQQCEERMLRVLEAAASDDISPRLGREWRPIESVMFSYGDGPRLSSDVPEVRQPLDETRLAITRAKDRWAFDEDGNRRSKLSTVSYAEALFEAMIHRFYEDPTMIAYGEENRDWGGAFGVYRGLTEALPYHRLFNSPISEAAIVGTAVGYGLGGGRAVVELMYADFLGRAGDELFNQLAKWQAMSAGELQLPVVVRVSVGSKYGAQHSQDWSALVAHIPGLQVMFPATPYDAKGMLNRALRGTDPVVFFESQRLYPEPETLVEGGVPTGYYEVELGTPATRRPGSDLTIVTIGPVLYRALAAAEILESRYQVSTEVIDARFMNPLDYRPILESIARTGRLVVAADACERGGFAQHIASTVTQAAFDELDAPPAVVGARNWITPGAELEDLFFPQPDWIVDTVHERILPLPGHQPTTVQTTEELLRRERRGT
jgi:2-oxoisovalerate dehydrogenase E1 component